MNERVYRQSKYPWIHRPEHPRSTRRGNILEHRWLMEQNIGRPLPPDSIVHHRNREKHDNRIENLLLMRSEDDHFAIHRALESGRLDLVAAYENWSYEFMDNLKSGLPLEKCYPSRPFPLPQISRPIFILRKNPNL